jgi:exopolysaccharide biosynthesis polyprenyl glycosylphosphotransferase
MSDAQLNQLLIDRFGSMSPTTRIRCAFYSVLKASMWKAAIASGYFIKRLFDIFASVAFLILLSPLLTFIALLIKLEDRGPILFAQSRVGKFGKHFKMYKFRSMRVDAEQRLQELLKQNGHATGVTFKMKNDPRITRVGKFIRKYSLDELPQFVNVLKGEMSMVGPRPPVPREVALYTLKDRQRLAVTPGLTCFWQIGGRANIDFPEQVQLDVQYIESQNFWLDLWICIKTVPAVVLGRGAC